MRRNSPIGTKSYREIALEGFDRYDAYGAVIAMITIWVYASVVGEILNPSSVATVQVWGLLIVGTIIGYVSWRATRFYLRSRKTNQSEAGGSK